MNIPITSHSLTDLIMTVKQSLPNFKEEISDEDLGTSNRSATYNAHIKARLSLYIQSNGIVVKYN
jgi:hypothetical protein